MVKAYTLLLFNFRLNRCICFHVISRPFLSEYNFFLTICKLEILLHQTRSFRYTQKLQKNSNHGSCLWKQKVLHFLTAYIGAVRREGGDILGQSPDEGDVLVLHNVVVGLSREQKDGAPPVGLTTLTRDAQVLPTRTKGGYLTLQR